MSAPLSKEEPAGLVAEIVEVEREIRTLEFEAWSSRRARHWDSADHLDGLISAARARLADLKRREASDERE